MKGAPHGVITSSWTGKLSKESSDRQVRSVRRKTTKAALIITVMLAFTAAVLPARQSSTSAKMQDKITQEVPNNPSPHPAPEQPLPYSHKTHLALGLTCATCHTNPDPGRLMTFPATSTCMQCHKATAKNKPAIQRLTEYSNSGEHIPWVRVYTLLPGVQWSHRRHLQAGMKCEMCHGQVAQMERMSEVTSVTTMYSCYHCHQQHQANTVCETCHVWPANPVESSMR